MTRRTLALVMTCMVAAGCDSPTAPAFPLDAAPTAFSMNFGGYGFGSHDVTLRGDSLVIVRRGWARADSAQNVVVPTHAQWAAFWRAADAAGVRTWASACSNTNIADGGGYELSIAYDGGQLASQGTNAYPRRDGTCSGDGSQTPEYTAFVAAISVLIGQAYP